MPLIRAVIAQREQAPLQCMAVQSSDTVGFTLLAPLGTPLQTYSGSIKNLHTNARLLSEQKKEYGYVLETPFLSKRKL